MNVAKPGKVPDDILRQIKHLRLMDDVLMVKCFEDNPKCAELLLGLIFKKSAFQVNRVKAMWHGSTVGLAILATNSGGWRYKIRVFRDDTADKQRNPGLNLYSAEHAAALASIDQKIAAHFAVYIVEHGATRKPIDRGGVLLDGWNEHGHYGFGTSAFYVNCDRKNRSPLGQLMYDFSCTDPSYMNYPILVDRVRYFKEGRQGIRDMCEIAGAEKTKSTKERSTRGFNLGCYLYVKVVFMIERLINLERPYGEPEYSRLSEQIINLKQELIPQLDQEGKDKLEELADTYIRQETVILCDAFADGFWSAVELMLEFRQRKQ